jgi:2-keto-4-pentenoate hydratase/2-oxohepta-3-ene-1,7-dioic acid hydratase in catechol pathway
MKRFYRIRHDGAPRHVVEESARWHLVEGDIFGGWRIGEAVRDPGPDVLAPVVPSKIVAVGLNYKDHAAEQGRALPIEPMIFLKPSTAERDAAAYVFGITCVNDVTARELQKRDVQYTRAKGFDTFAPLGPCIATEVDYRAGVGVEGWVNGTRRQASSTRELIFSIERLVAFISSVMTLLPGDVISTGTPAGIGPLSAGDRVTIKVEGVGELTNPVIPGDRKKR